MKGLISSGGCDRGLLNGFDTSPPRGFSKWLDFDQGVPPFSLLGFATFGGELPHTMDNLWVGSKRETRRKPAILRVPYCKTRRLDGSIPLDVGEQRRGHLHQNQGRVGLCFPGAVYSAIPLGLLSHDHRHRAAFGSKWLFEWGESNPAMECVCLLQSRPFDFLVIPFGQVLGMAPKG